MLWKLGVVAELLEGGTALLSAVVHSAAYAVYKRRQRGLREPLGSSKYFYFDGLRVKRRYMTKRRMAGTHACFEDDVAKDNILERCRKGSLQKVISEYVRDTFCFTLVHEGSSKQL